MDNYELYNQSISVYETTKMQIEEFSTLLYQSKEHNYTISNVVMSC